MTAGDNVVMFKFIETCWCHIASQILIDISLANGLLPDPTLQWRHNEHDVVSIHQRYDWLLNRLFRRIKVPRHWPLWGDKWPVTWKRFPFDDVIMTKYPSVQWCHELYPPAVSECFLCAIAVIHLHYNVATNYSSWRLFLVPYIIIMN